MVEKKVLQGQQAEYDRWGGGGGGGGGRRAAECFWRKRCGNVRCEAQGKRVRRQRVTETLAPAREEVVG